MSAIISDFSLTLTEGGVLASTFTLLTIFIGMFVGNLMPRIGIKRLICTAMCLSAGGGLVALVSSQVGLLILGRALEGLGLVIMMIAGPTAVSMFSSDASRAKHTGAWAAFMPFGTAISFILAPAIIPEYSWQGLWWISILFSLICLFAAWLWIPNDLHGPVFKIEISTLKRTLRTTHLYWIGGVFATHSLVFHVVLQFIPIYGTKALGVSFSSVSLTIAGFCILNIFGNFISGVAIHRGIEPYRLMSIQFFAVPLMALLVFAPNIPDSIRFTAILVGAFFTSLTPSAAFTLIARIASQKSDIPAFNGLMLQVQGAGILFGPSVTGWAVEYFDSWMAAGVILTTASILVIIIANTKLKLNGLGS